MSKTELEFMGNNRYLKYRYAQETPINVSTISETWAIEQQESMYKVIADYIKRALNMRCIFEGHKYSFLDADEIYTDPGAFNNSNVILQVLPSSFFYGQEKYFSPSPVFGRASVIIVSGPPKKVLTTTFDFLNIDTNVLILMGSTLVFLSLLLVVHSIVTNKYKSLPTKRVVKKMAQETLENVWDNVSLFCLEPIPSVLPHITCRLIATSWLIGVTFILFFLGCFLRTEFSTESYNYIDTLSNLIKSGITPTLVKESETLDYLNYLAAQDPVVKEWLDAQDEEKLLTPNFEYLDIDGYKPILSGEKALIIVDFALTWMMGEILILDPEFKKFFYESQGLYFSQQAITFDYMHYIFNTSWLRNSPQLHENLQLSLEPIFETQVFNYRDFEKNYLIEQITWKRPLKSTTDLDLSSVFVPFYMLFVMLSGTLAAVFTEIIFNHFA